jgi:hypothetical protein
MRTHRDCLSGQLVARSDSQVENAVSSGISGVVHTEVVRQKDRPSEGYPPFVELNKLIKL